MVPAGSNDGIPGGERLSSSLQLIERLRDGRFHSGEELGAVLGISRSAVWKKIKKINSEFGVIVHSVSGRGYRLAREIGLLAQQSRFEGRFFAWDVLILETVDSTNAEALRRLALGNVAPYAVVAEQQTFGRGRRGRVWVSPFGENLYFSLVIKVERGVKQLEGLSLVVGLAVAEALRGAGLKKVGLKWPNDVLVDGRKIAGILLELVGDLADVCHVVIGVGINVNMLRAPKTIDQDWTSASLEVGGLIDRNALLMALQTQLDEYLAAHVRHGFAAFTDEWALSDLWSDKVVILSSGERKVVGIAKGVDATGALRLLVDGCINTYSGGELSLRLQHDS